MRAGDGGEDVRAWRPPVPGVREVLHARFREHVYPPHTHDVWTLFLVDAGHVRYDLEGRAGGADRSMVTVLPPHVVHDGRPGATVGYRKRVLYLETALLPERLVGPAVDAPVLRVPGMRARLSAVHDAIGCVDDALEAETRLAFVVERIAAALGGPASATPPVRPDEDAAALRAYLDARLCERVTITDAARELGAPATRLARSFSRTFGIAPHAYVLGRRLEAARERILDGVPLAAVAAELGFADQAHLTRRFHAFLGVPPGRFRRARRPAGEWPPRLGGEA